MSSDFKVTLKDGDQIDFQPYDRFHLADSLLGYPEEPLDRERIEQIPGLEIISQERFDEQNREWKGVIPKVIKNSFNILLEFQADYCRMLQEYKEDFGKMLDELNEDQMVKLSDLCGKIRKKIREKTKKEFVDNLFFIDYYRKNFFSKELNDYPVTAEVKKYIEMVPSDYIRGLNYRLNVKIPIKRVIPEFINRFEKRYEKIKQYHEYLIMIKSVFSNINPINNINNLYNEANITNVRNLRFGIYGPTGSVGMYGATGPTAPMGIQGPTGPTGF